MNRTAKTVPRSPEIDQWRALRDRLEAAKRPLLREIREYPPQVAGCDLHFKDLAEKRDRLFRELDELEKLRAASADDLRSFAARSAFLSGND